MRDIFLVIAVLLGLGVTLKHPFVGVLIWEWFSLMQPHEEAYGFSRSLPLNYVIALVTVGSWLVSKEPKKPPAHPIIILLGLFLLWTTFNSFFAFDPTWSWPFWDRTWKIFLFGFMVAILATNKLRVDALIWVAAISLLYYGVKGGVFTFATGGNYKVFGPENTIISDNNQLALALLMIIPLVEYLRTNTPSRLLSWALLASMVLTGIAVLGSYSRGAYIAMAAIAIFALLKARRKFVFLGAIVVVLGPALFLMPQAFYDRLGSLSQAGSDASFQGRVTAWKVAFKYAVDHFPFGAGFYGPQLKGIFNFYFPAEEAHAAHSIYFQTLGEHGFIGLILYLMIVIISLRTCGKLASLASTAAPWTRKLARMIQISLIAFFVGGAALSMAYYDLFLLLACLLPQLARQSPQMREAKGAFRATNPFLADTVS